MLLRPSATQRAQIVQSIENAVANEPSRVCPACSAEDPIQAGERLWPIEWRCQSCGYRLAAQDGIPVLAPELATRSAVSTRLAFAYLPRLRLLISGSSYAVSCLLGWSIASFQRRTASLKLAAAMARYCASRRATMAAIGRLGPSSSGPGECAQSGSSCRIHSDGCDAYCRAKRVRADWRLRRSGTRCR